MSVIQHIISNYVPFDITAILLPWSHMGLHSSVRMSPIIGPPPIIRAYRDGPSLWTHQSHQRLPMVLFDFQKWWHVWTVCILDQKFNENTPGYYLIYHYYMVNQNTLPSVQIMEQFWTVKLSCNRIPGKAPRIINIDRLFDRPWVHNKGSKILIWLNSTWTRSLIFICHFANTTGL